MDAYLNVEFNLPNQRIQSWYFSLHSRKNSLKTWLSLVFLIFHNNTVSSNRSLENVELLLDELAFHFDVTGILETKITNSDKNNAHPSIPGNLFKFPGSLPWLRGGAGKGPGIDWSRVHMTTLMYEYLWLILHFDWLIKFS